MLQGLCISSSKFTYRIVFTSYDLSQNLKTVVFFWPVVLVSYDLYLNICEVGRSSKWLLKKNLNGSSIFKRNAQMSLTKFDCVLDMSVVFQL